MAVGTVKWFSRVKGYGFLTTDTTDKDMFVHISAVKDAGLQTLREGQEINYEVNQDPNGRDCAVALQLMGPAELLAS